MAKKRYINVICSYYAIFRYYLTQYFYCGLACIFEIRFACVFNILLIFIDLTINAFNVSIH